MKGGEHVSSQEYRFQGERITIGRGRGSHLMLPASWVRSTHAIVNRAWGGYRILVTGWDEITSLNGEGIVDEQPCLLQDGDVLRIGSFRIEVQLPNRRDRGTGAHERKDENPFAEPVGELFNVLERMSKIYDQTSAPSRDDALDEALSSASPSICSHPAVRRTLDEQWEEKKTSGPNVSSESAAPPGVPSSGHHVRSKSDLNASSEVLDVLSEALATTLKVPAQFRYEFIGHPLTHPPDTKFLYEGSGPKIKQHLTGSTVSSHERSKRLEYVQDAAQSVVRHQVAIVRGYKASVITGVKELLQRLDPDTHQEDVAEGHPIFEYVPILTRARVLDRVREACRDLLQDDWSVAEQRVFRPAFTRAYLAHVTSPHTPDEDVEQHISEL